MSSTASDQAPPSTTNKNTKGIDIRSAMSILSSRAEDGGDKELRAEHQQDVPAKIVQERRAMGQSIDLESSLQWTKMGPTGGGSGSGGVTCPCPPPEQDVITAAAEADPEAQEQRRALEEQGKQNEAELRAKLDNMSVSELLRAVLSAQGERTVTYKTYDGGLDTVLSTGNITAYPGVVAAATASFSVLSDTINAIRTTLVEKHGRKDVGKLIADLQRSEKEKLSTTAALHLERIREKNEEAVVMGSDDTGAADSRVHNMLREGVATLRAKVQELVETINETLEDIRYAAVEEEKS
mmetsp:Transcript_11742/g.25444  ORF Transcript_11742/g.25444 Transcript_11742/m.25444 type:complete len:296 (+) Transcript_11742:44-931(+)